MTKFFKRLENVRSISTHTLTWSVTHEWCLGYITKYFNSHAHVERDHTRYNVAIKRKHFNSHAHVERDMGSMGNGMGKAYFNSHAHVERDFKTLGAKRYAYISTHTLTWSVTPLLSLA